jgi:hypothetical protein
MLINWVGFEPRLIDISECEHTNIDNSECERSNIDNSKVNTQISIFQNANALISSKKK